MTYLYYNYPISFVLLTFLIPPACSTPPCINWFLFLHCSRIVLKAGFVGQRLSAIIVERDQVHQEKTT